MDKNVWKLIGTVDTNNVGCPLCGGNYGPRKPHFCPPVDAIVMWIA